MLILNKKIGEITEEDAKWFVEKFASKEIELLKKVTHLPFSCDLLNVNGEKDLHELIVKDDYCMDSVIDFKLKFELLEERTIGPESDKDIRFDPYLNDDTDNNKCYNVTVRLGRMHVTENSYGYKDSFNAYLHVYNTKQKIIRFLGMPKVDMPLYNTKEYVLMEAEYALQLDGTYANLATGHVLGM